MRLATRLAVPVLMLGLSLVAIGPMGCGGEEEEEPQVAPQDAPGSNTGAPPGAPIMKGDPSAVPASGMKTGADRLIQRPGFGGPEKMGLDTAGPEKKTAEEPEAPEKAACGKVPE